ncbi:glycosyl transferase family 2 [Rhodopirellula maiorica SM1]|uniref:Glycosyl transferase family 2 n=1 Tax=Rhodopirellula maiorica SM1 TaxID=1265738 RepID=M5RRC8_9BACT|nr:glycosyl transferase family 2 [Rhodopirellula maiorica SM1]
MLLAAFWISAIGLLYGFIIYPGILFFVGQLKGGKTFVEAELPRVSLVIAAYNEESVLKKKLENALEIDYPSEKLEILLGSDGSNDLTAEIASRFFDVGVKFYDYRIRRGKPSVLNETIAKSSGEVLFLCDANVMFDPHALKRLVAHLGNPAIGAVTGDVRLESHEANFGEGESAYYKLERAIQLGESKLGSVMGVDGGMYIIRRSLFDTLPSWALNEEFIASMRVIRKGFRIAYEPDAFAIETATPTATQEWRRRVRVSAGSVQILRGGFWPPATRPIELWQFLSHKALRWANPLLLAVLFVASAVLTLSGAHPLYKMMLFMQAAFYSLATLATISLAFRNTKIGGIAFYFTMSHIAMAVGMVKGLLGRQATTWKQADRTFSSHTSV